MVVPDRAIEEPFFGRAVNIYGVGRYKSEQTIGFHLVAVLREAEAIVEHPLHLGKLDTEHAFKRWRLRL